MAMLHGHQNRGLQDAATRAGGFGRFGKLFPGLAPLKADPVALRKLADTMVDDPTLPDNLNIPSGYTYLGQFIDHDITLDTTAVGEQEKDTDALIDFRTPLLDLDNLYGKGPDAQPSMYDRLDSRKLAVGRTQAGFGGDPGLKAGLPNDLLGLPAGPPPVASLPSDWVIDWNRFYQLNAADKPTPAGSKLPAPPIPKPAPTKFALNFSRPIDPLLAKTLHVLPEAGGSLPFLNLLRGVNLGLPSGQDVVAEMNRLGVAVTALTPDEIAGSGPDGARAAALGFADHTPLWYYILKEAQLRAGSQRLGPTGSRILAEVFIGLLQGDSESFLNQRDWQPTLGGSPGTFTMPDLLRFVGDLDPVNEPTSF